MIFRRYGTFKGGIDLPDEKHQTLQSACEPWPGTPEKLLVPLVLSGNEPAQPVVEIGADVSGGQRIAESSQPGGLIVHAPLAGHIAAISRARVADRDGFVTVPALEMTDLRATTDVAPLEAVFDFRTAPCDELRCRIDESGLVTHRMRPQLLSQWVRRARDAGCRTLICNGMEHEPYVTADHRLLVEYGTEVIRGLALLSRAIEAPTVILAVDQRRTYEYRQLVGPARLFSIERVALTHKYPTGADAMLGKVLLRREVPLEGTLLDLQAAVIDPASCMAAYRGVCCRAPLSGRVVTIAGEHVERPGNYWVPFGMPCSDLTAPHDATHIHGGPMTGLSMEEGVVVGPTTSAALSLNAAAPPPPGPCIRCGWCTDHCPARLNVSALNDMFELGDVESARKLGALACVNCGLCTYVCPARLPLAQRVKELKRSIYVLRRATEAREASPPAGGEGNR
jgi:electron transport complex protein RnfC